MHSCVREEGLLLHFHEVTSSERLPDCLSAVMRGYIVLINVAFAVQGVWICN